MAEELGLPIDAQGRVLYPDAQIEYVDSEGRSGRVNVEVASGHYRPGSVRAKAAAGFRMHANGPAGARVLRALGCEDHGSIRGPAERDPGSPTWDVGSISPNAPSAAARAIPSSPAHSRGTPTATGTEARCDEILQLTRTVHRRATR